MSTALSAQWRPRSSTPLLVAVGTLLAFGILVAPYGLPPSGASISASALLGFNNTLAYALYLPLLAATAWVVSARIERPEQRAFAVSSPSLPIPSAWVWGVLAAHATFFFLLYRVKGQFIFADGLYFQHTAYRVLSGEIPYAEFSFLYGPATVYPQAVLASITSPTAAYALYYVGVYLLGLYALYVALVWLGFRGRRADLLFVLLSIGFFNPMTGLNYTPLRHLLPLLAVGAAWSYLTWGAWQRLIVGAVILWLAIMYSPDMGAVALAGVLLAGGVRYVAMPLFRSRAVDSGPGLTGFLALPALAALLAIAAFTTTSQPVLSLTEYLAVVPRLARGGSNTPIQPSLPLLSLVAFTAAVAGAAVAAVRRRGVDEDSMFFAVLVATLVLQQRAAFAKPDSFHLAFAALPMCLVGLKVFGADTQRCIPVPLILGLVGIIVPLQYFNAAALWPALATRRSAAAQAQPPASDQLASAAPIPDQLQAIVSSMGKGAPYYMHNLTYYSLPLYVGNGLRHALYFTTPEEAFTDDDIQGAIRTLTAQDSNVVVLRKELEGGSQPAPSGSSFRRAVNMLVAAPIAGSITYDATGAAMQTLWNPFLGFLRRCYEARAETPDLVGLIRSPANRSCGVAAR